MIKSGSGRCNFEYNNLEISCGSIEFADDFKPSFSLFSIMSLETETKYCFTFIFDIILISDKRYFSSRI